MWYYENMSELESKGLPSFVRGERPTRRRFFSFAAGLLGLGGLFAVKQISTGEQPPSPGDSSLHDFLTPMPERTYPPKELSSPTAEVTPTARIALKPIEATATEQTIRIKLGIHNNPTPESKVQK